MGSLLAGWRVSLRRARADWPIVLAAFTTTLLATTLLAAGPIYSAGVSVAGLRQMLAESSIEAGNVRVNAGVPLAEAETVDQAIVSELERAAAGMPAEIARIGTGDTFALPGQGDAIRDLAAAGFAEGIEGHATLIAGEWPQSTGEPSAGVVPIAISDVAADQLGLTVGQQLELTGRLDETLVVPVSIAAIFQVDDPGDPFWWADPRTIDGLTESQQYRTFGPFVMSRADLLGRATSANASLSWRLIPNFEQIATDDIGALRGRLLAIPNRLAQVAGTYTPTVETELPGTLSLASQQLLVSRTGMLLVMAQLAILGGYAILLTAGLLIDHRRVETALLRSRGAGSGTVATLALIEGLMLALPAVLIGPWLAILVLRLFEQLGPLASVGLTIPLRVTADAYLAAGLAGLACVLLLCLPALLSARSFTSEEQSLSRADTKPLAQRLGIDFALLAVAAIAIWQLRLYGGPLTRNLQGALGPDPLLIAAPALGLLLGAVVATRLLPRMAEAAQGFFSRGRGLVGALGSFQLARRPLRYTRSALMLMLAMSIGVFAVSYSTTWTDSQRSQADHQVGADAVVSPSRSVRSLPPWSLYSAYRGVASVEQATPIERTDIRVGGTNLGTLVALDSGAVPGMVRFRDDQASASLTDLLRPLADARPQIELPRLAEGTSALTVTPTLDIRDMGRFQETDQRGEFEFVNEDPAQFDEVASIAVSAAVRDAQGVIHRIDAIPVDPAAARDGITIPLETRPSATSTATLPPSGPLELVSIDMDIAMPQAYVVSGATIAPGAVSSVVDGAAQPVDLGSARDWKMVWVYPNRVSVPLTPLPDAGFDINIGDVGAGAPTELATDGVRPVSLSMQPATLSLMTAPEIPVVVNRATADATALSLDETILIDLAGAQRRLRIAGLVDSFPTTDTARPLIVADLPTLALLRMQEAHKPSSTTGAGGDTHRPEEWWLDLATNSQAVDDQAAALAEEVSQTLAAPPFSSVEVTTLAGRLRGLLSDPVAVGIIGALGLGAIAAALFALIGLAVGASVSARQRQTEFALMRALGLSRRQLSGWLWLENGSLALISVLVGTALGALISWVVLPSVTVTGDGLPPTPPVIVTMPIITIALLGLIAGAATAVVVVVMGTVLRRMGIGNVLRSSEE